MRARKGLWHDLLRLGQTSQLRGWSRANHLEPVEERPGSNEPGLPPLQAPEGAVCARCSVAIGETAARRSRSGWRHDLCPS